MMRWLLLGVLYQIMIASPQWNFRGRWASRAARQRQQTIERWLLSGAAPLDQRGAVAWQAAFFMVAPDQVSDCRVWQPSASIRFGGRRVQADPGGPPARAAQAACRW